MSRKDDEDFDQWASRKRVLIRKALCRKDCYQSEPGQFLPGLV